MKPTRFYSDRQERAVARSVGGRAVAASGATPWQKGDVQTDDFIIECKTSTTEKRSFSIKRDWLEKLEEERIAMRKPFAALAFDFGDGQRRYIVDERTFRLYLDLMKGE